jgi:hypothetical protein
VLALVAQRQRLEQRGGMRGKQRAGGADVTVIWVNSSTSPPFVIATSFAAEPSQAGRQDVWAAPPFIPEVPARVPFFLPAACSPPSKTLQLTHSAP